MTADHSLQPFDFIFIFLFSCIPMTTIINTSCKTVFNLNWKTSQVVLEAHGAEEFGPLSLSSQHYSGICNKHKISQEHRIILAKLHPLSFSICRSTDSFKVFNVSQQERTKTTGWAGSHIILFKLISKARVPMESSSEKREANTKKAALQGVRFSWTHPQNLTAQIHFLMFFCISLANWALPCFLLHHTAFLA